MQYIFEFLINILAMGKPDRKDIKWLPLLILVLIVLGGFTMYYTANM